MSEKFSNRKVIMTGLFALLVFAIGYFWGYISKERDGFVYDASIQQALYITRTEELLRIMEDLGRGSDRKAILRTKNYVVKDLEFLTSLVAISDLDHEECKRVDRIIKYIEELEQLLSTDVYYDLRQSALQLSCT